MILTGNWWQPAALTDKSRIHYAPLYILIAGLLVGCAPPLAVSLPESAEPASVNAIVNRVPVSFTSLPGWQADNHREALQTFVRSCHKLRNSAPAASEWRATCADARRLALSEAGLDRARHFFETRFVPYHIIVDGKPAGLVTGYFEPELRGSWRRSTNYRFPLYRPPSDLVSVDLGQFRAELKGEQLAGRVSDNRLVPYATRGEIRRGSLTGRNLELLWLDNPIDTFFLHIQGSGRVIMDNGEVVRVGFAGRNGHAYFAIGRDLITRGAIRAEDMSLQSIRAWLSANPRQAAQVMDRNRSYIFFRLNPGPGPLGALGVPLTAGRSLAVDRLKVPLGAPVWLDTIDPLSSDRPLRRLMIAQDTGSAIKGAARGDFFWGAGVNAKARAGRMRHVGRFYLLLPRRH